MSRPSQLSPPYLYLVHRRVLNSLLPFPLRLPSPAAPSETRLLFLLPEAFIPPPPSKVTRRRKKKRNNDNKKRKKKARNKWKTPRRSPDHFSWDPDRRVFQRLFFLVLASMRINSTSPFICYCATLPGGGVTESSAAVSYCCCCCSCCCCFPLRCDSKKEKKKSAASEKQWRVSSEIDKQKQSHHQLNSGPEWHFFRCHSFLSVSLSTYIPACNNTLIFSSEVRQA